jgi:hypothetical protein
VELKFGGRPVGRPQNPERRALEGLRLWRALIAASIFALTALRLMRPETHRRELDGGFTQLRYDVLDEDKPPGFSAEERTVRNRIDGTPRSYRDRKGYSMEAARLIKSKSPHSVQRLAKRRRYRGGS